MVLVCASEKGYPMNSRLLVLGIVALIIALLFTLPQIPTPIAAQGPNVVGPIIGHAVRTGASAPLRDMPVRAPRNQSRRIVPLYTAVSMPTKSASPILRDPVVQKSPATASMPIPLLNFEGTSNITNYFPPDTNGDIGYDPATGIKNYVQWVNIAYQVWDVTTTPTRIYGPVDGSTLWTNLGAPCSQLTSLPTAGDIIILFDTMAHRWLASAMANNGSAPYHQCVAISKTADPTGEYWLYDFIVSNTDFNDYPKWAVWPDGYYLTVNQFGASGGAGAYVFDRTKMLTGDPSATFQYFNLPSQFSLLPSNLNGPTIPPAGSPNYLVQLGYDASGIPQNPLQVWQFHTDWTTTTNSTITLQTTLTAAPFDANLCNFSQSCIPEPPVTNMVQSLDALSDRLMYRLQYRNFGGYETMVVNHTVAVGDYANHAGVRWYEFRMSGGGPWSIYQQGTYAPDANDRWMGSLAMDGEGNIALGYSVSSTTVFPSIRYTGRLVNDPLGQLPRGEATLITGNGAQTYSHRWGDYTSMSIDPVDDCTFWYTNEYYSMTQDPYLSNWQTRIGSFWLCRDSQPQLSYFFPVILKDATLP
jgi:hypothetical protein